MLSGRVSIIIPTYNNEDTISEALDSCVIQDYPFLEIIVSNNASVDRTREIVERYPQVKLVNLPENIGGIDNMNYLLTLTSGEFIVMLCADDYFTHCKVVADMVKAFSQRVGFVGRYYYQFLENDPTPIRSFHTDNPFRSADNWSGLGFRAACMPIRLSKRIFLETADMVKQVLDQGWDYQILKYDTVAVRSTTGKNGSQNKFCYVQSPIKNWIDLIGLDYSVLTSFVSLIQIKNWGSHKCLIREIRYFIKYRPINLLRLDFWFFVSVSLFCPKKILKHLVNFYKVRVGRLITKRKER